MIDYIASRLPSSGVHRLYFDFGTETLDSLYEPFQNRMDSAMRDAGYIFGKNWISYKFEGHDHSEHSWRSRVSIPLKFLLGR